MAWYILFGMFPLDFFSAIFVLILPVLQVVTSLQKNKHWGWIPLGITIGIICYWFSGPQVAGTKATDTAMNSFPWMLVLLVLIVTHLVCRFIVYRRLPEGESE